MKDSFRSSGQVFINWFNRYFSNPEAIAIFAGLAVTIILLNIFGSIIGPIIAAVVISYLLLALVRFLQKCKLSRFLAVIISYLIFIGIVLFCFLWLFPVVWQQLINLFLSLPNMIAKGQVLFAGLAERFPDLVNRLQLNQILQNLNVYTSSLGNLILRLSIFSFSSLVNVIIYFILVPILVFFFLRDTKQIVSWLKRFLPEKRPVLENIGKEIQLKIGSYVKGKIIEILIVSLVSIVVFLLLHLQYAFLLGALVGISVIIPYIGVTAVTIPIVIIGFMEWGATTHFFYTVLAFAVIVALDANLLVPLLFAEVMELHPIVIILSVLIFGVLGGFWGIFLAIPLATLAHVIYKNWPRN
jgi:putative permease